MMNSNKVNFENLVLPAMKDALVEFKRSKDLLLLKVDANERSITHRFAHHMNGRFGAAYQIDCEYNRVGTGGDKKALHLYEKEWAQLESELQSELAAISSAKQSTKDKLMSEEGLTIYPDIIVHQRGNNDHNLLVIEAKKTKPSSSLDKLKLKLFTSKMKYQHGVFIQFGDANHHTPVIIEHWIEGQATNELIAFDWASEAMTVRSKT